MLRAALVLAGLLVLSPGAAAPVALDRTVVRFSAPETGGSRQPLFISERLLAFEARLEALMEGDAEAHASNMAPGASGTPYRERHVRAALERHIAETLLASLRIDPEPTRTHLAQQAERARQHLEHAVGGASALAAAARAEGISDSALGVILRRQARASLYLDRMVAPMLNPPEAELRALHGSGRTPFRAQAFEQAVVPLKRWYVGRRLSEALSKFFQGARSRLSISVLTPLPRAVPRS